MNRKVVTRSLVLAGVLVALVSTAVVLRSQSSATIPASLPVAIHGSAPAAAPAAVATPVARLASARPHVARHHVTSAPPATHQPMDAGMRIFIDPETGTIGGPTQAQLEEMAADAALNQSTDGLVQVTMPDGSVMMNLEGRFQDYYMVKLDAKGRRHVVCGRDQRAQFQPTPASAELPEK